MSGRRNLSVHGGRNKLPWGHRMPGNEAGQQGGSKPSSPSESQRSSFTSVNPRSRFRLKGHSFVQGSRGRHQRIAESFGKKVNSPSNSRLRVTSPRSTDSPAADGTAPVRPADSGAPGGNPSMRRTVSDGAAVAGNPRKKDLMRAAVRGTSSKTKSSSHRSSSSRKSSLKSSGRSKRGPNPPPRDTRSVSANNSPVHTAEVQPASAQLRPSAAPSATQGGDEEAKKISPHSALVPTTEKGMSDLVLAGINPELMAEVKAARNGGGLSRRGSNSNGDIRVLSEALEAAARRPLDREFNGDTVGAESPSDGEGSSGDSSVASLPMPSPRPVGSPKQSAARTSSSGGGGAGSQLPVSAVRTSVEPHVGRGSAVPLTNITHDPESQVHLPLNPSSFASVPHLGHAPVLTSPPTQMPVLYNPDDTMAAAPHYTSGPLVVVSVNHVEGHELSPIHANPDPSLMYQAPQVVPVMMNGDLQVPMVDYTVQHETMLPQQPVLPYVEHEASPPHGFHPHMQTQNGVAVDSNIGGALLNGLPAGHDGYTNGTAPDGSGPIMMMPHIDHPSQELDDQHRSDGGGSSLAGTDSLALSDSIERAAPTDGVALVGERAPRRVKKSAWKMKLDRLVNHGGSHDKRKDSSGSTTPTAIDLPRSAAADSRPPSRETGDAMVAVSVPCRLGNPGESNAIEVSTPVFHQLAAAHRETTANDKTKADGCEAGECEDAQCVKHAAMQPSGELDVPSSPEHLEIDRTPAATTAEVSAEVLKGSYAAAARALEQKNSPEQSPHQTPHTNNTPQKPDLAKNGPLEAVRHNSVDGMSEHNTASTRSKPRRRGSRSRSRSSQQKRFERRQVDNRKKLQANAAWSRMHDEEHGADGGMNSAPVSPELAARKARTLPPGIDKARTLPPGIDVMGGRARNTVLREVGDQRDDENNTMPASRPTRARGDSAILLRTAPGQSTAVADPAGSAGGEDELDSATRVQRNLKLFDTLVASKTHQEGLEAVRRPPVVRGVDPRGNERANSSTRAAPAGVGDAAEPPTALPQETPQAAVSVADTVQQQDAVMGDGSEVDMSDLEGMFDDDDGPVVLDFTSAPSATPEPLSSTHPSTANDGSKGTADGALASGLSESVSIVVTPVVPEGSEGPLDVASQQEDPEQTAPDTQSIQTSPVDPQPVSAAASSTGTDADSSELATARIPLEIPSSEDAVSSAAASPHTSAQSEGVRAPASRPQTTTGVTTDVNVRTDPDSDGARSGALLCWVPSPPRERSTRLAAPAPSTRDISAVLSDSATALSSDGAGKPDDGSARDTASKHRGDAALPVPAARLEERVRSHTRKFDPRRSASQGGDALVAALKQTPEPFESEADNLRSSLHNRVAAVQQRRQGRAHTSMSTVSDLMKSSGRRHITTRQYHQVGRDEVVSAVLPHGGNGGREGSVAGGPGEGPGGLAHAVSAVPRPRGPLLRSNTSHALIRRTSGDEAQPPEEKAGGHRASAGGGRSARSRRTTSITKEGLRSGVKSLQQLSGDQGEFRCKIGLNKRFLNMTVPQLRDYLSSVIEQSSRCQLLQILRRLDLQHQEVWLNHVGADVWCRILRYLPFRFVITRVQPVSTYFYRLLRTGSVFDRVSLSDLRDRMGDSELKYLAPLIRDATYLNMAGCHRVSDVGFSVLASYCREVRELSIARCERLTDVSLQQIGAHMHNLVKLSVAGCVRVGNDGVEHVARCKRLRVLELDNCPKLNEGAFKELRCRELKSLSLMNCSEVTDFGLKYLSSQCPELECLRLNMCHKISTKGISYLKTPKLRLLDLERRYAKGCLVSERGILHITSNFRKLEYLDLCNNENIGLHSLKLIGKKLHKLKHLFLENAPKVDGEGIKALVKGCRELRSLSLVDCRRVGDDAMKAIIHYCHNIRSLDLTGCKTITNYGMRSHHRGGLAHLSSLKLSRCPAVSDGAVLLLAERCPRMKVLCLDGTGVSDESMATIRTMLRNLREIDLRSCENVTPAGITNLVRGLELLGALHFSGKDTHSARSEEKSPAPHHQGNSQDGTSTAGGGGGGGGAGAGGGSGDGPGSSSGGSSERKQPTSHAMADTITTNDCLDFLSKSSLTSLHSIVLTDDQELEDGTLSKVLSSGRFTRLSTVGLQRVSQLTTRGVLTALLRCNAPLRELNVAQCPKVSVRQLRLIRKEALRRGFQGFTRALSLCFHRRAVASILSLVERQSPRAGPPGSPAARLEARARLGCFLSCSVAQQYLHRGKWLPVPAEPAPSGPRANQEEAKGRVGAVYRSGVAPVATARATVVPLVQAAPRASRSTLGSRNTLVIPQMITPVVQPYSVVPAGGVAVDRNGRYVRDPQQRFTMQPGSLPPLPAGHISAGMMFQQVYDPQSGGYFMQPVMVGGGGAGPGNSAGVGPHPAGPVAPVMAGALGKSPGPSRHQARHHMTIGPGGLQAHLHAGVRAAAARSPSAGWDDTATSGPGSVPTSVETGARRMTTPIKPFMTDTSGNYAVRTPNMAMGRSIHSMDGVQRPAARGSAYA